MTAQRAIVTGCSSGIGRATCLELTARGYDVIATARRAETLADLKVAHRLTLDVDSDESVDRVREEVGTVDVLVNNAGFGVDGSVEDVPLSDVRRMFETNFFGPARMIKAFLPGMRERGSGAVVNVTSTAGIASSPLGGYYSASKFALEALSESLNIEAGHFGVKVRVIEPGYIETSFQQNLVDFRVEPGPYRPLAQLWEGALGTLRGGAPAPGPELVASVIADSLTSDSPRLRWPVGADAELVASARQSMNYEEFVEAMRQLLHIDW